MDSAESDGEYTNTMNRILFYFKSITKRFDSTVDSFGLLDFIY
jgi:hypothetical protein